MALAEKDLHQEDTARVCSKCKSANWDKPYQFRRADWAKVE